MSAPSGTLTANSHCQPATDRIAAATLGPSAEEAEPTMTLTPKPRPRSARG